MSTHCHIRIRQANGKLYPCMIYKHFDGYPSAVLPILEEFARNFGDGPEYAIAQIIRLWTLKDFVGSVDSGQSGQLNVQAARFLEQGGWGIVPTGGRDLTAVDYTYTIDFKTHSVLTDPDDGVNTDVRNPEISDGEEI